MTILPCYHPEVSSIPLSHCTFRPARKNLVHISKLILSFLVFIFLKLHKLEIPYAQESLYKEMSICDLNANWAVLGIKMAENGGLTTSIGSIPCAVPTHSVTEFMGHLDKSNLPCKVGFIMDLYCQNHKCKNTFTGSHIKFQQILML